MPKKNKEKKKSPYPENGKVRIRHSYYTFAREFPSKILPLEGKRRKHRKKRIAKNTLFCLLFVSLMLVSCFTVNLLLDISYTDKDKLTETAVSAPSEDEKQEAEPLLPFGGENVRALYMPAEKLGDREYIKAFIKQIKAKNCNSVLIDFKNSDGKLSYTSLNENAILARCTLFDNNTVRHALDLFENEEIKVIARIFCFTDNAVATAKPSLAVKYMDTEVNWIDSAAENGGRSRLNPLSKNARKYILSIIEEILQFKIDGVLLEEVSFPSGEYAASATYPGEKNSQGRNKTLLDFVSEVKNSLPENCLLLLGHSARDVLEDNSTLYFGSMLSSAVDGFAVNTLQRSESVIIDKKTDYFSIFSMFSAVKSNLKDKRAVYTVDISEYSASYLRRMKKAGYTDYIIYSTDGNYN